MAAYTMVHVEVHDADEYGKYAEKAGKAVAKFGGKFLARGGKAISTEGPEHVRNVIVEFPDFETAQAFYNSPEYADALSHALKEGVSTRDFTIVDGV